MSNTWYYVEGHKTVGPLTLAELAAILSRVTMANEVLVWRAGLDGWVKAENIKELAPYVISPPPLPTQSPIFESEPTIISPNRRYAGLAAGVLTLAIFIFIGILPFDPLSPIPVVMQLFVICFAGIAVVAFWKPKRKIAVGIVVGTALGLFLLIDNLIYRVDLMKATSLGFSSVADLDEATKLGIKTPEELAIRRAPAIAVAKRKQEKEAAAAAKRKQEEEVAAAEKKAAPQRLAQRAISKLPMQPKWGRIEITKAEGRDYGFTLVYRSSPSNNFEVELDTKTITRAVLAELVASGANPSSDGTFVFVFAQRPVQGETGTGRWEVYGSTYYNPYEDSLVFKQP